MNYEISDKARLAASWEVCRISEVCEINPKTDFGGLADEADVTFLSMPMVEALSGKIDTSQKRRVKDVKKGFTRFRNGDILFAKITPCMENGKVAIADHLLGGRGAGSTEFHVLRTSGNILNKFVFYYVIRVDFRRTAQRYMSGAVGQKRVPSSFIANSEIPLPPLNEQRRIVAKIEVLTGRIARARTQLSRIKSLADKLKIAILEKTFATDEPADTTLAMVANWGSGGTPKSTEPTFYAGEIPWIRSGDLPDGPVKTNPLFITEAGLKSSSAKWIPAGAVLIAMYGATIGKLGITTYPVTSNQAVAFAIPLKGVNYEWLYFTLLWKRPELIALGQGGAQPNISQQLLKNVKVNKMSPETQVISVQRIKIAYDRIDRLVAKVKRMRTLLDRLESDVFTKAFHGELVAQDPGDEPASA